MAIIPLVLIGIVILALIAKQVKAAKDASANAINIMPLGDSVTQGDHNHASYRRPLWHMLQADGFQVQFVGSLKTNFGGSNPHTDFARHHEGHWGWRADEILAHLPKWAATYRPDIVLLLLGGNDVNQGQDIESTIAELGQIIETLRQVNPDVTILLAQLMATSAPFNQLYMALNTHIPELVTTKSTVRSPVILVDQQTGFDIEHDTYDGLHPNASGEQKMARKWYAALRPILETSRLSSELAQPMPPTASAQ